MIPFTVKTQRTTKTPTSAPSIENPTRKQPPALELFVDRHAQRYFQGLYVILDFASSALLWTVDSRRLTRFIRAFCSWQVGQYEGDSSEESFTLSKFLSLSVITFVLLWPLRRSFVRFRFLVYYLPIFIYIHILIFRLLTFRLLIDIFSPLSLHRIHQVVVVQQITQISSKFSISRHILLLPLHLIYLGEKLEKLRL